MKLIPANETRRSFLKKTAPAGAAASAFTIIKPELVRGAGKEKLKAGIVGCGGRGSQAMVDILTANPNVEVAAMGDLFEDHLEQSLVRMQKDPRFAAVQDRLKVAPDHRFTGFDAYKKILASDVDIVMLCTPPGYRPMHFEAAIAAKKHVFAEKPVATDPVGARRFLAAAEKARQLKLTVMSGAQNRSTPERIAVVDRIRGGGIGEVVATYAFCLVERPVFHAQRRESKWGDMEWQHRNWYSFVWLCGDQIVEQHFHNIDVVNWAMGTHPVSVVASGGASWRPREALYGNIYDHVSADFVYANGVRLTSHCRQYPPGTGMPRRAGEIIVGSKGTIDQMDLPRPAINPQELEHVAMVKSILGDGPYINHGREVAESTLTGIMGRESAYSGLEITWDQIMASKQDLMPKAFDYNLKMDEPPLPVPGQYKFT